MNMIFEVEDLDPKLKAWADLVLKCVWFLWNLAVSTNQTMVIMNIVIGIDDLDLKSEICEIWSQS